MEEEERGPCGARLGVNGLKAGQRAQPQLGQMAHLLFRLPPPAPSCHPQGPLA